MYLVDLTYIKPLAEIDKYVEEHRHFLEKQYEKGIFLASGAKTPRNGGVFLVRGKVTLLELETILNEDPFWQHQLARYEITTFTPSKFHESLKNLL
jgi:uncharacterized protein YciI